MSALSFAEAPGELLLLFPNEENILIASQCDLRSGGCSSCERAGTSCAGYRHTDELRIVNETRSIEERVILRQKLSRYTSDLDSSYVGDNPDACWCPSVPHCGNAVRAEKTVFCEPKCSCGQSFCFACKGAPHSPCTCDM